MFGNLPHFLAKSRFSTYFKFRAAQLLAQRGLDQETKQGDAPKKPNKGKVLTMAQKKKLREEEQRLKVNTN